MSRIGKQTDKSVNEFVNDEMKEGLYMDFTADECHNLEAFEAVRKGYVDFNDNHRRSYVIGYDTLINHRRSYQMGEMGKKNMLANWALTEELKFVQKCRKATVTTNVSTSEVGNKKDV